MQEQIEARAGLNGGGVGHGVAPVVVAPVAAMPAGVADTPPVLTDKARLESLMEDPLRRADIHRRVTTTDEAQSAMAEELGVGKGTFSRWLKKQAWPRPPTAPKAPQRSRSAKRKPTHGNRDIAAVAARLISAVDRQIGLVEKPQRGRKADVEEKDSRILGNLAKTLGTLMQMGSGGTTSNHAEPPDRDEDVEERLAERIKRWARGEQGY